MAKTGAEVLLESLLQEGVEVVFGYPGGANLPVYDVLYGSPLRHILVRHEQAAAHAADAYARATGKVGVCMATSGPGATNLITGLATAHMDSIPVVAITGQVATTLIGSDAFQEADVFGISIPVTKHNYLVKNPAELPRVIREAFYIASSGRPGPVLIDLPKDIAANPIPEVPMPAGPIQLPGYRPVPPTSATAIQNAVAAIQGAERPLILMGGGIIASGAHRELIEFAELTQIPVISTLMGLGGFPGNHPLFLGMVGMHGSYTANRATSHADLVIALGVRFDDRVTGNLHKFAPRAKIIHVEIDPAEIGKNVFTHYPVAGDVKHVLRIFNKQVKPRNCRPWLEQLTEWQHKHPIMSPAARRKKLELERARGDKGLPYHPFAPKDAVLPDHWLKPQDVIEELWRFTGGDAIIATDVGQHQMWTALFYPMKRPRQLITSGGLGTMGYGLPAAIGAKVARPDQEVWLISGDGSFQMTVQELATAVMYDLPIRVMIVNNGYLGMVRQWQELFYKRRYSHVDMGAVPDFVKLAEAYGCLGLRATTERELREAFAEASASPRPVVLDVLVEPEENVFPMVPSGAALEEILLGD